MFNNKENERIELPDGRVIFNSRSVAVHVRVKKVEDLSSEKNPQFLLIKRGDKCPDEIGKWAEVTGYLDWDENSFDASRREVYEESGILLSPDDDAYPFKLPSVMISTDPKSNRQNIIIYHTFKIKDVNQMIPQEEIFKKGEVSEIKFMNPLDLYKWVREKPEDFAWNHAEILSNYLSNYLCYQIQ